MHVHFHPGIFCKNLINKCINGSSIKETQFENLKQDMFCLNVDEAENLKAKIKYFEQAKIFKQKRLKKLPLEIRNKSVEKQCIKNLRVAMWIYKKRLRELEFNRLFFEKMSKSEHEPNKPNLPSWYNN